MIGRIALTLALSFDASSTLAQSPTPTKSRCEPLVKVEAAFAKSILPDKAQFTKVTPGQFHFLQGVSAMAPNTPPGLPPGDSAILAKGDRAKDGVILFVRAGKLMCFPMSAPPDLLDMIESIVTDKLDDGGDEL